MLKLKWDSVQSVKVSGEVQYLLLMGHATIFIKGTCNDIKCNSSKFKPENCKPLALAFNGILPFFHVLQTHCLPSKLM